MVNVEPAQHLKGLIKIVECRREATMRCSAGVPLRAQRAFCKLAAKATKSRPLQDGVGLLSA
jgi:hypothetical protein